MTDVQITKKGTIVTAEISGNITGECPLFSADLSGIQELWIDLSKMQYLNSLGVKHWVLWTGSLKPTLKITMSKCPSSIINQVNMVAGFLPSAAIIESFYIPYSCEKCSQESSLLHENGKHFVMGNPQRPGWITPIATNPCPKCKVDMEPDVVFDQYFAFLKIKKA